MKIVSDRFISLPPSAHTPSQRPFRASPEESQASIPRKRRRLSASFLWVTDGNPNDDVLVQCELQLDIVKSFLCNYLHLSMKCIDQWKDYLFSFGQYMTRTFNVDVISKRNRAMRHISYCLIFIGCPCCDYSEKTIGSTKHLRIYTKTATKRFHYYCSSTASITFRHITTT